MQYKEALFDNSEETSKSWGWLRLTNASKNHYSIALQNKSDYSGVLSGFGFWINRLFQPSKYKYSFIFSYSSCQTIIIIEYHRYLCIWLWYFVNKIIHLIGSMFFVC